MSAVPEARRTIRLAVSCARIRAHLITRRSGASEGTMMRIYGFTREPSIKGIFIARMDFA
jgi:hypothetical protein